MFYIFCLISFCLLLYFLSSKNLKINLKINDQTNDQNDFIFPLKINICNQTQSFMSTNINSDLLITLKNNQNLIKENECNIRLNIYRFNGQNLTIDSIVDNNIITTSFNKNFGKINNTSLTTQIYGYNQQWIPCPLIMSPLYNNVINISLEDLNKYGGLYYGSNNLTELIIPISLNQWKLGNNILTLYEPYATTREEMDKLKYFTYQVYENKLVGNVKGYRDKDQKFKIEWIRWILKGKNDKFISYGTIRYL
jgi:hypothetical protein